MNTNIITTQQQQTIPQFVIVPTVRCEHSIIGIYQREHDTVGCVATYPVELVLAFNAQQQAALVEWMEMEAQIAELESDQSYTDWLDSLEFAEVTSREEMLWTRFDEYWSERGGKF